MNYSAVIFDLDGTILLNEEVYEHAFRVVLKENGAARVAGEFAHVPGVGMEENWRMLKLKFGLPENLSVSELIRRTQEAYRARLGEISIRPGFFELHEALSEEGILVGLATSNDWWLVADELENLGLDRYFNATVTREEVLLPKPDPAIFWETARKLGVPDESCIVIEDSKAGVEAGIEAGMKTVAVLGSYSAPEDFPRADLIVPGFEDLNPKVLDVLFLS